MLSGQIEAEGPSNGKRRARIEWKLSGNAADGIFIEGASIGNSIRGNYIGQNAAGTGTTSINNGAALEIGGVTLDKPITLNNGVMTTLTRSNDQFTARRLEPGMILTVKGKVEDGKAKVGAIVVQEGAELNTYDSVDKVPEKVRNKVKELVEMSEKGAVKSEIKAP